MTVWKPLYLSAAAAAHVPPFLLSAALNADAYTIHLTDLTNIWSESLDRRGIIRRSEEERTSIDPNDDDQFRILLEKIRLGLEGRKDTTSALTINADDGRPTIILNLTVPLPGGLAPLQWPVRLSAAPQSVFASQLTMPLLGAQHAQMQEIKGMGELLEAKDHVIQKLLDKLESIGTELSQIFPQLAGRAGRKIERKQAEERVRGLGGFDMETWRHSLETEKPQDAGHLISEVFGGTAGGVQVKAGATRDEATGNWWEDIKGITVNLTTGRISTNGLGKPPPQQKRIPPKPSLPKESSTENDDFQIQATPPRLASRAPRSSPPKPALEDTTDDDDDDDLGGPSQVSRIPDSYPKPQPPSQNHRPPSPSPPAPSPPKPKRLGKIGGKKAAPKSSPPPVEDDATTEGSVPPSPPKEKPPSPTLEPAAKPKTKGKLGRIGGKKAAPPPPPEDEPEPEAPKPKSKLGKIGGKKVGTPAPDSSPPRKIKTSPHSSQAEPSSSKTADGDQGRSAEEKEKTPEPEETIEEKADRKREELKRELEETAKMPVKKKRRF